MDGDEWIDARWVAERGKELSENNTYILSSTAQSKKYMRFSRCLTRRMHGTCCDGDRFRQQNKALPLLSRRGTDHAAAYTTFCQQFSDVAFWFFSSFVSYTAYNMQEVSIRFRGLMGRPFDSCSQQAPKSARVRLSGLCLCQLLPAEKPCRVSRWEVWLVPDCSCRCRSQGGNEATALRRCGLLVDI